MWNTYKEKMQKSPAVARVELKLYLYNNKLNI